MALLSLKKVKRRVYRNYRSIFTCDLEKCPGSLYLLLLLRYWWSRNYATWLDKRQNWQYPTKKGSLRCYFLLITNSLLKNSDITWFFPEILMIKESCNLIGREPQFATSIQKQKFQIRCCLFRMAISMQNTKVSTDLKNISKWIFTSLFRLNKYKSST